MIPRDLIHHVTVADPSPHAAEIELQRALWSWKSLCEEGATALERRDLDSLDAALAARESLRPRIAELVPQLRAGRGTPREALATLRRLQQAAAEADRRLIDLLETERVRIKSDIDGLGRPTTPTGYDRLEQPRHRLDIVR